MARIFFFAAVSVETRVGVGADVAVLVGMNVGVAVFVFGKAGIALSIDSAGEVLQAVRKIHKNNTTMLFARCFIVYPDS